jgi:hypothetical protein
LKERIKPSIDAGEAFIQLPSIGFASEAAMHKGFAFEARKPILILGLADTRKRADLLIEVLDHGIGPIGGDILLHNKLLLPCKC